MLLAPAVRAHHWHWACASRHSVLTPGGPDAMLLSSKLYHHWRCTHLGRGRAWGGQWEEQGRGGTAGSYPPHRPTWRFSNPCWQNSWCRLEEAHCLASVLTQGDELPILPKCLLQLLQCPQVSVAAAVMEQRWSLKSICSRALG